MSADFTNDLAWSHAQSDQPWWEQVYREAFTGYVGMRDVRQDGWAQRAGIDRYVDLRDGTSLKVDEKVRRRDYPDICLEYWSDVDRKVRGWVAKDLSCDYIAYAFEPTATCYLFPFQTLRRAWRLNRERWVSTYPRVEAKNAGWTTVSVAVPTDVVLDALRDAITVRWARTSTERFGVSA